MPITPTIHSSTRRYSFLILILINTFMGACSSSKPPSPTTQQVLTILQQYSSGLPAIDEHERQISGEERYRIIYNVHTTVKEAVSYYESQLHTLGIETRLSSPSSRDMITFEGLPVDHWWWYDGCPLHSISLSITDSSLHLIYSTGRCR